MKIAIISDIHENFHNLIRALEISKERGVERVLCLGDLINPGVGKMLAGCGLPVHLIWGNNDGDRVLITKAAASADSQLTVSDKTYDFQEIADKQIFMTHYTELAQPMAKSGEYDLVLYGHNHQKHYERVGRCHIVNPGELSGHLTGDVTFAIYDSEADEVEFVDIEDAITLRTPLVEKYLGG